ncbi:MAG: VanZ family protein [Coriobacteriaceae bacterium]|nr:MAG: VanZ family protein [Coriobacteriaceae bacterium]
MTEQHRRYIDSLIWVILWICVIWGHSFMNGFVSGNESGAIVRLVTPLAQSLQVYDTDLVTFVVRKCAHFTEYLILGLFVSHAARLRWYQVKAAVFKTALTIVAVSLVDEFVIQANTVGRSPSFRDVLIDCAGACAGLLILYLRARHRRRTRSKDTA